MKYILALLLALFIIPATAEAGQVLYEAGDFQIKFDELSVFTGYDLQDNEVVYGSFTSIATYKMLNADMGIIGGDSVEDDIVPMAGISLDLQKTIKEINGDWNLPQTINAGFFGSYDIKDENFMYGPYASLEFKF
jgi:hypothetical protein